MNVKKVYRVHLVSALMPFYAPDRIEGYCKACTNYNRVWSCPPHGFTGVDYLKPYAYVMVVGHICENATEDDFQMVRRKMGDDLLKNYIPQEMEVLIAGNCYQCEVCARVNSRPCIHGDQMKYSLESLGFDVAGIAEHLLNHPLEWPEKGEPLTTFATIGAVFCNRLEVLETLKLKWNLTL